MLQIISTVGLILTHWVGDQPDLPDRSVSDNLRILQTAASTEMKISSNYFFSCVAAQTFKNH